MRTKQIEKLASFDAGLRAQYGSCLCGIDEAGRGAFAGPITAGAVILPHDPDLDTLAAVNDSKKMPPEKRAEAAEAIKRVAIGWSVAFIEAPEIDRYGIQWANEQVMIRAAQQAAKMAFERTGAAVDFYMIDQCSAPFDPLKPRLIQPKADSSSLSVASASVLAKVTRDLHMLDLHQKHPAYDWAKRKGYYSEEEVNAVNRYGIVKGIHRESWQVKGYNRPVQTTIMEFL